MMTEPGYPLKLLFCLLLITAGLQVARADTSAATEVVESFHKTLLESMQKADQLDFAERYEKLSPVIARRFDTPLIVQVILSRYWRELDATQQESFIDLFHQLSTSTYAARFNSYDGESFTTTGTEELKRGRLLVKTEFTKNNGEKVKFDYLLHEKDGSWYIISVIANGVNDLALKREEYAAIISTDGFDKLVEEIRKKISEYGNTASGV